MVCSAGEEKLFKDLKGCQEGTNLFTTVSESTIRSKGANYKRRDSSWISGKKILDSQGSSAVEQMA